MIDQSIAQSYERPIIKLILLLVVPLLFLPKINLVPVQGQTAGLRIDDLLILGAAFLVACGIFYTGRPLLKIEKLFLCFLGFASFSVLWNWFLFRANLINGSANPIVVVRLVEYFTFFYIGQLAIQYLNVYTLLMWLFSINCVLVILQTAGMVGGFTVYGYQNVQGAATGLTAGHWEVGFIFNLIYAVFLFSDPRLTGFSRYQWSLAWQGGIVRIDPVFPAWILVNAGMISMSGSRSAALGMVGITLFWLLKKKQSPLKGLSALLALSILALTTAYALSEGAINTALFNRSQNLLSTDNIQAFRRLFDKMDVQTLSFDEAFYRAGTTEFPLATQRVDMSWFIRMHKWCYASKAFWTYPMASVIGLGPGYFGTGMDGGLLRLFYENGVVGGILFFYMLFSASRTSAVLQACLLAFGLNMLFLDTYIAYKGMSLYFFILGALTIWSVTNRPQHSNSR